MTLYRNLVDFQAARLKKAYADFLASERIVHITQFFFSDVYSTEDQTERDTQFKSLYEFFRRRLGENLTRGIGELVELNDLSRELDGELARALEDLVRNGRVDDAAYEEGYRRCDNYDVRARQIEMLCRSIRYFRTLAERRSIGLVLAAVKKAALLFGGRTVIGFLDRGYHAYRSVTPEETETFVRAVHDRERARLDRIFGKPGWKPVGWW